MASMSSWIGDEYREYTNYEDWVDDHGLRIYETITRWAKVLWPMVGIVLAFVVMTIVGVWFATHQIPG